MKNPQARQSSHEREAKNGKRKRRSEETRPRSKTHLLLSSEAALLSSCHVFRGKRGLGGGRERQRGGERMRVKGRLFLEKALIYQTIQKNT